MLRGSVTEELVFGFDVGWGGRGEGMGGRQRIRARIRSGGQDMGSLLVQTWTRQRLQGRLWIRQNEVMSWFGKGGAGR